MGNGVSVDGTDCVNALDVAKMAWPVSATTVERESTGKSVGADSVDCEHAAKSPRNEARMTILIFMIERRIKVPQAVRIQGSIHPAGRFLLQTVDVAVFLRQIADVSGGVDL